MKEIQGTVIKRDGKPKSHQYIIRDNDGNEYFAHFGDLRENETILERLGELSGDQTISLGNSDRADLKEGDTVKFEPRINERRAIHIHKK